MGLIGFKEFRLNSVLLSISGIILGLMLAAADYHVNWRAAAFLVLTIICLQLFSSVIPGVITAIAAVWFSYGTLFSLEALIMLLLGYFVYRLVCNHRISDGLFRNGIVIILTSVLIYGLLPVYGSYFLCTHSFGSRMLLLPSLSIGFLSLAAINAGYYKDKTTRIFNTIWVVAGIASMTVYSLMRIFDPWHFSFLIFVPLFLYVLVRMWQGKDNLDYGLCISFFVLGFALTAGFGFMTYLFI